MMAGCANGASPLAPSHLRVDDAINPVGTDSTPYFGWYVNDSDQNEIQSKYQILVASTQAGLEKGVGDLWDSGQVASRDQNHIAYAGKPLGGDTQAFWKVRTWDKDGNAGPYSPPARWVVGPVRNEDWSGAKWIRRTNNSPDDYTYCRQSMKLPDKPIARATAYITSVHKYALYINGKLVGKGPAYHYPQYQFYNGYDVTELMTSNSSNQFAIFNHWFGGGQGRAPGARGVIMKCVVHFQDGTSMTLGTDGNWRQSEAKSWLPGQAQHNRGEGVGFIEKIDARNLTPNWNMPDFDDSSWEKATEIGSQPVAPWVNALSPDLTRITETVMTPASITDKGNGKYVIDLGKVYAGTPLITFTGGEAGTTINMLGGYALGANGEIDPSKNQQTALRYFAVLDVKTFTYEPVEFFGMRYFQIENSPMPVTASNFKFVERHSAMSDEASSFVSSNTALNATWDLMKHSLYTCAQESFVDTPSREKGAFLMDGLEQSMAAMRVMGERLLTRRAQSQFLQSMDQYWSSDANRGRMNAVYPNVDGGRDIPDFTEGYLVWAWDYYMATGDRKFLADNYAKLKSIGEYLHRSTDAKTGLITNLPGGSGAYRYGIIDWPAEMRFGYDMTEARTVINGWAYADYEILSKIAAELNNTADRDLYRQETDKLKEAINSHVVDSNGLYVDGVNAAGERCAHVSQQANIFPLALGIIPPAHFAAVKEKVKELKMSVGMVTVMWLVRALGEADEGQHLLELYTNSQWNGWARSIAHGATATWETWNSDTDGTSMSHAWGAIGLNGYVSYILGVQPLKPQFELVQIKPLDFGDKLTNVKGKLPTDRGDISIEWSRKADRFVLNINMPANMTADVCLPKGEASDSAIEVDGTVMKGSIEGRYIRLSNIGSGKHTLIRALKPS